MSTQQLHVLLGVSNQIRLMSRLCRTRGYARHAAALITKVSLSLAHICSKLYTPRWRLGQRAHKHLRALQTH